MFRDHCRLPKQKAASGNCIFGHKLRAVVIADCNLELKAGLN